MTLTRWSPVLDVPALEIDRLNRMFGTAFGEEPMARGAWVPAVDILETADKDIVVKVDLPEMKREDIKVSCENSVLTVEGEREMSKEAVNEQYHRVERGYGSFRRTFTLPATIDAGKVTAAYADGVLTVKLPRREETRPRQITVNG